MQLKENSCNVKGIFKELRRPGAITPAIYLIKWKTITYKVPTIVTKGISLNIWNKPLVRTLYLHRNGTRKSAKGWSVDATGLKHGGRKCYYTTYCLNISKFLLFSFTVSFVIHVCLKVKDILHVVVKVLFLFQITKPYWPIRSGYHEGNGSYKIFRPH